DAAREQAEVAGMLELAAPELDAGQAALDAAAAELEAGAVQIDLGSRLVAMAAEYRTVAADGSAALVTVVFSENSFDIAPETREEVLAVFDEPIEGVVVGLSADVSTGVPEVFGVAEAIGLVVAAVVLVIM